MKVIAAVSLILVLLVVPFGDAGRVDAASHQVGTAHLVFVGDVMLGRYVGAAMQKYGYATPFSGAKSLLEDADVTVGNLEGPVLPHNSPSLPAPSADQPLLAGDTSAVPAMAAAGFDIMSLANNHSLDAGLTGLRSSRSALAASHMSALGMIDSKGRQLPLLRTVQGVRIAFLAYTAIRPNIVSDAGVQNRAALGISYIDASNQQDKQRFHDEIATARLQADVVVVFMHWGTEYAIQPNSDQLQLSQLAATAGADLVVGAHPHVAQGMATQMQGNSGRATVVAYSLGNALFDQVNSDQTRQGMALDCRVDAQGVVSARLVPLEIRTGSVSQPGGFAMQVDDNSGGQPALARAALSTGSDLQWQSLWEGTQTKPGSAIAYRRNDARDDRISFEDLGTGSPTSISLHNGRLSVMLLTNSVWHSVWLSDPGWQVTGYSVGDADGDGKPDLIFSLWKKRLISERPDGGGLQVNMQGGDVLPHIYISTWRDGAMVPLWDGSPRPAPTLALGVAHIGAGNVPLLAVLQSSDLQKEQTPGRIRLWQWSGNFGYELVQELPGMYSQMWSDGAVLMFR